MSEQHDLNIPVSEPSIESERFYRVIRKGSQKAIAAHAAAGRTIAIWKDGRVVRVAAEDLLRELQIQVTGS